MSKKDTQQQKASMSLMFRGREIFKPLNTGRIDEKVSCVREWVANIFFYTKGDTTVMIDAGYNYERLTGPSFAPRFKSVCMTPWLPTTAMTSGMTRRKTRALCCL